LSDASEIMRRIEAALLSLVSVATFGRLVVRREHCLFAEAVRYVVDSCEFILLQILAFAVSIKSTIKNPSSLRHPIVSLALDFYDFVVLLAFAHEKVVDPRLLLVHSKALLVMVANDVLVAVEVLLNQALIARLINCLTNGLIGAAAYSKTLIDRWSSARPLTLHGSLDFLGNHTNPFKLSILFTMLQ